MRPCCASARRSPRAANLRNWLRLSRTEIGKFLHFDHLYFVVLKENSKEIEYLVWGKGPVPLPDLPMEELPCGTLCAAGIHSILPIGTRKSDIRDSRNGQRKWASGRVSAYL